MSDERLALKEQKLNDTVALLRHIIRHNGAAISARASLPELADHATDVNPERVGDMFKDINTIDQVKNVLYNNRRDRWPDLTTEQLMEYDINDARLVADHKSWAVVRITKQGSELVTYGGDYYQKYHGTDGELHQEGDVDILRNILQSAEAAWVAEIWTADLTGRLRTYSEGGEEFYLVPCDLPGSLDQLLAISIDRSAVNGSGEVAPLAYNLTEKSCDASYDGMLGLPHGIWLIYDNSTLKTAPEGLMIPKRLADGNDTGFRFDRIRITYNALASGLKRLRLVGDSFGEEYIVSTQDLDANSILKGTWTE